MLDSDSVCPGNTITVVIFCVAQLNVREMGSYPSRHYKDGTK